MSRQEDNRMILYLLSIIVEENPELRFGQILSNYVLKRDKDPFHEEPRTTLNRILEEYPGPLTHTPQESVW